jgi:hypothetical protein
MILNPAQAEAVFSAMCALNNVGGRLDAYIGAIQVKEFAAGITVVRLDRENGLLEREGEQYIDQAAFAATYNLN